MQLLPEPIELLSHRESGEGCVIPELSVPCATRFTLASLIEGWQLSAYAHLAARRVVDLNGREKIQYRIPLGILEMELDGRPDGDSSAKTALDTVVSRIELAIRESGKLRGISTSPEERDMLRREASHFSTRALALFELGEVTRCMNDARHFLRIRDLLIEFDEAQEATLAEFYPDILRLAVSVDADREFASQNFQEAVDTIERGIQNVCRALGRESETDIDELRPETAPAPLRSLLELRSLTYALMPLSILRLRHEYHVAELSGDDARLQTLGIMMDELTNGTFSAASMEYDDRSAGSRPLIVRSYAPPVSGVALSDLLRGFEPVADIPRVRKIDLDGGVPCYQVRLDIGMKEMTLRNRPDGYRPRGYASFFDLYCRAHQAAMQRDQGSSRIALDSCACSELFAEARLFYERIEAAFALREWRHVIRDAQHCLQIIDLVELHGERSPECAALSVLRPCFLRMGHAARASQLEAAGRPAEALASIALAIENLLTLHEVENVPIEEDIAFLDAYAEGLLPLLPADSGAALRFQLQRAIRAQKFEEAGDIRTKLAAFGKLG